MPVNGPERMEQYGAGEILLTSMDRDGTKAGYDLELTREISERVDIPVIASGGVGNLEHIYDGLTEGKASAALAASIFHFREYSIAECKNYLQAEAWLSVRCVRVYKIISRQGAQTPSSDFDVISTEGEKS